MKNIAIIVILLAFMSVSTANETRVGTLQSGYYIDDISLVNNIISLMPNFGNQLYGDLAGKSTDGGIFLSKNPRSGTVGVVMDDQIMLGCGRTVKNLDVALGWRPSGQYWMGSVGVGRNFFTRRIDLASNIKLNQDTDEQILEFILRLKGKKNDWTCVPAYSLAIVRGTAADPEFMTHRIGFSLQRSLLEEGLVYVIGQYDVTTGDLDEGEISVTGGVEMRLGRVFGFRCGVSQTVDDKFEVYKPVAFTPGLRATFGDFDFDFFVNRAWPFQDDEKLLVGAGVDFRFDRY